MKKQDQIVHTPCVNSSIKYLKACCQSRWAKTTNHRATLNVASWPEGHQLDCYRHLLTDIFLFFDPFFVGGAASFYPHPEVASEVKT